MNLRSLVVLVSVLFPAFLFAQSVTQIGASSGPLSTSIDREKVRLVQELGAQVPLSATFRDESGAVRTFGDLVGDKPTILIPIFFLCKGVCGLELQGTIAALHGMQAEARTRRELGRDFNIVVMSIDPTETPSLAAGKRQSTIDEVALPGTEKGWHFVVGDFANIHKVTDAVGFRYTFAMRDGKSAINHPSGIVFVSPKGKVSSYIYGATYTPRQVVRNLDFAGRDQVGPPAEEFFFGCICVDPITGKRSFEIQNILKVLGVATIAVLGLSIMVLSGKTSLRRRRIA